MWEAAGAHGLFKQAQPAGPTLTFPGSMPSTGARLGSSAKSLQRVWSSRNEDTERFYFWKTSVNGFPRKKAQCWDRARKSWSAESLQRVWIKSRTISWSIALLVHQTSGVFSGSAQIKSREQNDCNVWEGLHSTTWKEKWKLNYKDFRGKCKMEIKEKFHLLARRRKTDTRREHWGWIWKKENWVLFFEENWVERLKKKKISDVRKIGRKNENQTTLQLERVTCNVFQ